MIRIYLDMDGVLADFDRGVRELCHMDPPGQGGNEDTAKDNAMWAAIRAVGHFYDKLELMPGAREMFSRIWEKYGKGQCEILTGIPKAKRGITTAGDDKIHWMRRLLSEEITVNIVYREEKPQFCNGKDCILIDDRESNIREWAEMGGTGILHESSEKTLAELERMTLL